MIRIRLDRIYTCSNYTIGHLYINDEYVCDTLEDCDRGLDDSMSEEHIKELKKPRITAIPTGTYKVLVNKSPRFNKDMPAIVNVKGFSGIRIHCGNTSKDTEGCVLVGYNKVKGMVLESRKAFAKVMAILYDSSDITIDINTLY